MSAQKILVAGLPESGKTTFLAALWHLVSIRELKTELQFETLVGCDATHLNKIAGFWRDAVVQTRTSSATYTDVLLRLKSETKGPVSVTFPDLSGEEYRDLWERRAYYERFGEYLTETNRVLLFIHADKLNKPRWIFDEAFVRQTLSVQDSQPTPVSWSPKLAPTQVQLVDLLQLLVRGALDVGPRKLCVVLSAWDKAEGEELTPAEYLKTHLPLLQQFLETNPEYWTWTVVGVSAQGGDYGAKNEQDKKRAQVEVERVQAIEIPSTRIRVVGLGAETHDLTQIIRWLAE